MKIIQNTLVSDPKTHELVYKNSQPTKIEPIDFLITLITYPIFAVLSSVFLIVLPINYLELYIKRKKMINVLSGSKNFEKFAEEKLQALDKQIHNLKYIFYKLYTLPGTSSPPGGLTMYPDKLISEAANFPKADLEKFSIDFLETTFFQTKMKPLEKYRVQLFQAIKQKKALSKLSGSEKTETINNIAQLIFLNQQIKIQEVKKNLNKSLFYLLPIGFIYNKNFNRILNEKSIYEGNKKLLHPSMNKYSDLVDAHNQIIKKIPSFETYLDFLKGYF